MEIRLKHFQIAKVTATWRLKGHIVSISKSTPPLPGPRICVLCPSTISPCFLSPRDSQPRHRRPSQTENMKTFYQIKTRFCKTESNVSSWVISYPNNTNTNKEGEGWGPLKECVIQSCEGTHCCKSVWKMKDWSSLLRNISVAWIYEHIFWRKLKSCPVIKHSFLHVNSAGRDISGLLYWSCSLPRDTQILQHYMSLINLIVLAKSTLRW